MVKTPFWADPNVTVRIIESTREAAEEFGFAYGFNVACLRPEHIEALKAGKVLAWHGEYNTFIFLGEENEKIDDTSIQTLD